ncbi:O-antigen ligase family protein [Gemmatimonadota bacterium]
MKAPRRFLLGGFSVLVLYISLTATNLFDPYVPDELGSMVNRTTVLALVVGAAISGTLTGRRFRVPGLLWFALLSAYVLLHGVLADGALWFTSYWDVARNYLLLVITINVLREESDLRIYGLIAVVIIAAGAGLYYWYFYKSGMLGLIRPDSIQTEYKNINTNTVSLFMVLGLVIAEYLTDDDRIGHVVAMNSSYCLAAILIMFSGSRYGVLLVAYFFLVSNTWKRQVRGRNVALLAVIGVIALPVLAEVYESVEYFSTRLENVAGYTSEIRFVMMREAFEIFLRAPIWGGNGHLVYDPSLPVHNHLWFLNFLCSYGVIGFSLLLGLVYRIARWPRGLGRIEYVMFLSFIALVGLYAPPFLFFSIPMSFLFFLGRRSDQLVRAPCTDG